MVESQTLRLVLSTASVNDSITRYVSRSLRQRGYESATPSLLGFLSTLECGDNYGSEIARNMGVSRQLVARTVKELCRAGYLDQLDGAGKQKKIVFTATGEQLISDARQLLLDIDRVLEKHLGTEVIASTVMNLDTLQALIGQQEEPASPGPSHE